MIPFKYVEFYDVPRCIALHHGGKLLLLESAFDEKIDDYSDNYSVYVFPDSFEDLLERASWGFLGSMGVNPIGNIRVDSVKFDASKRLTLDSSCLDALFGKGNSK